MKITYEITINDDEIKSRGICYADTSADLLSFMAMLLRRETLGGAVVSTVGYSAGIPPGHTIVCTAIDEACDLFEIDKECSMSDKTLIHGGWEVTVTEDGLLYVSREAEYGHIVIANLASQNTYAITALSEDDEDIGTLFVDKANMGKS